VTKLGAVALAAALALVAAGCGGGTKQQAAPKPPRLPRALAQSWAQQANAVATAIAAGDGCTAQARAVSLRQQVIAAVNAHRIPAQLLEPLTSGVNDLAGRISCTPAPPPTPPAPPPHGNGNGNGNGHDKGHGHGHGHGHGNQDEGDG